MGGLSTEVSEDLKVLRPGLEVEIRRFDNPFDARKEIWYRGYVDTIQEDGCWVIQKVDPDVFPNIKPIFYKSKDIRFIEHRETVCLDAQCPRDHDCTVHVGKPPQEYDEMPRCDDCDKVIKGSHEYYHCLQCQWDCCYSCMNKRIQLNTQGYLDSDVGEKVEAAGEAKREKNANAEAVHQMKRDMLLDAIQDL